MSHEEAAQEETFWKLWRIQKTVFEVHTHAHTHSSRIDSCD
jgi:hypothetical protein